MVPLAFRLVDVCVKFMARVFIGAVEHGQRGCLTARRELLKSNRALTWTRCRQDRHLVKKAEPRCLKEIVSALNRCCTEPAC